MISGTHTDTFIYNDLVIIAESGSQEPFLADKIQMTDLNQGAQLSGIKNLGHTVQL